MKFSLKSITAAAILALAGVAGTAHAAAGANDLYIEVYDPSTQYYWIGDLGLSTTQSATTFTGASINLTAMTGWSTFAGDTTGDSANYQFFIVGGGANGTGEVTEAAGTSSWVAAQIQATRTAFSGAGFQTAGTVGTVSTNSTPPYSWSNINAVGGFGNVGQDALITPAAGGTFDFVSQPLGTDTSLAKVSLVNGSVVFTTTAAIPEPGTYALMVAGLLAVGAIVRRRSRA